jgi:hypothetical protein
MSKPGLKGGDNAAILTRESLLEIDDFWLEVSQDMDVAVGCGEWENHCLFFDQT